MIVNELPLLFSSTVRENMDPFNLYSDDEIQRVLESVGMWEELHPNPSKEPNLLKMSQADGKLLHVLEDGGAEFSLGLQQKLAIARVLLRRPSVLLMDSATSSLDEQVE
jgi:ABC-type multidrug transport system fused ATPase/permease subunit